MVGTSKFLHYSQFSPHCDEIAFRPELIDVLSKSVLGAGCFY